MNHMPLVIAGLVILDQAIWTLRTQLVVRGRRRDASLLGVVNAVVYVSAVAQVLTNLDNPLNIAGYALGVGIGTYLGSAAESRLGIGYAEVRLIAADQGQELVAALRGLGWPATATTVAGLGGEATQVVVVVDRGQLPVLRNHIDSLGPDAIVSVAPLVDVTPAVLPPGYRRMAGHR